MCKLENKICNLIRLADTNDSAVLNLSALFNPLLKKYAYKLSYEDAVKEYEYRSNTRLGKLVANRELPVLYRAKEMIDSGI